MKKTTTSRGFTYSKFWDGNGIECSLQKSSAAEQDYIWLGCIDADPKQLIKGQGWTKISMPDEYLANTRMHLTRKNVLHLLPSLIKFVVTGEI